VFINGTTNPGNRIMVATLSTNSRKPVPRMASKNAAPVAEKPLKAAARRYAQFTELKAVLS